MLEASPPTVRLVSNGAAPRKALRYGFKVGKSEFAQADVNVSATSSTNDAQVKDVRKTPTIRTVLKLDVVEVLPDGSAKIDANVERVTVLRDAPQLDEHARTALEQLMADVVGAKGHATVSSRGVPSNLGMEIPPGSDGDHKNIFEAVGSILGALFVALPEEELGVNATWDVVARTPSSGVMSDVKRTYTLKELRADSARMDLASTMAASSKQPVRVMASTGVSSQLLSLTGQGTGKITMPFARLVGENDTQETQQAKLDLSKDDKHQTIDMHTQSTLVIRPSKPAPANNAAKPKTK